MTTEIIHTGPALLSLTSYSLTRPCLALPIPALICDSLSVPKLTLHYPAWLCTVQYCPSRHPCPVLLTMPDPVTSCPALLNTGRPFVALPGPSRPRLVLTDAALFHSAWRCPARHCSARTWSSLHEHAQFRPTLPVLP